MSRLARFLLPLVLALPAAAHADLAPLPDAQVQALRALPQDPAPPALTRNSHYWVSNENALELFYPHIQNKGGVLIGVGTDQNYLFAGWAKPEILILMDFDVGISQIHQAYSIIFAEAADPEAFLAWWDEGHEKQLVEKIKAKYTEPGLQKHILSALKTARHTVFARLKKEKKHFAKLNIPTFLSDAAQYAYVRDLWVKNRVVALRGDLTATQTMKGIADLLKAQSWTVGVFYPSNAEQYFDFVEQYRTNVTSLPATDASTVIRTLGWGSLYGKADETYHYSVQPLKNFDAWLKDPGTQNVGKMHRFRTPSPDIIGFSTFDKVPGAEPTPNYRAGKGKAKAADDGAPVEPRKHHKKKDLDAAGGSPADKPAGSPPETH